MMIMKIKGTRMTSSLQKKAVTKFFAGKPGILMPLPTGQAIYFR